METLVGLEGLLSNVHDDLGPVEDETEESLRWLAREFREEPGIVDTSEHILAVARA